MFPLVLYDIPSKLPGNRWSPNPAKPRFVLGYKNLPFETVWVEYSDIATRLKELGASPNRLQGGREKYTIPVLNDPNTGAFITDSWAIAGYLDKTYPEKPIFPDGSKGLINAFDSTMTALAGDSLRFGFLRSSQILSERSRESFITARETGSGVKFDEWSPEGPTRDAHWEIIESFCSSAKKWYDNTEGKWVMGDTFCYADILLAARFYWFKKVYHDDEWGRIASLHDGFWERLLADVERECNLV